MRIPEERCKAKLKQSRYTPWRRLGERTYSSYSFTISAIEGGEWSASRPGRALPRGKDPRYPLDRRLGGLRAGLDTEDRGKILCPCIVFTNQNIKVKINMFGVFNVVKIVTLPWLRQKRHRVINYFFVDTCVFIFCVFV
jgi:hypothetical protein